MKTKILLGSLLVVPLLFIPLSPLTGAQGIPSNDEQNGPTVSYVDAIVFIHGTISDVRQDRFDNKEYTVIICQRVHVIALARPLDCSFIRMYTDGDELWLRDSYPFYGTIGPSRIDGIYLCKVPGPI